MPRRTERAAAPVLHLRPGRRPPAGRRPRDPRRAVLAVAGPRRPPRRRDRGADPERPVLPRPGRCSRAAGTCASPPAPASRRCCRSPSSVLANRRRRDPALRQPHHRVGDVRRGAGRPQEPLRPAAPARARALPRAARRRAVLRPARRRPAAPAADRAGRRSARFDHVWLCGPHAMLADARAVLAELGVPRRPGALRAVLRRRAAARAAPGRSRGRAARPPRSPSCSTGCSTTAAAAARRRPSSTARRRRAPTCRSPARAASAAPAAPRSPRARSTCGATTRSSRPRSRPGSC